MIDRSDPLERLRAANPVPSSLSTLVRPNPVLFGRIASGRIGPTSLDRARRRRTRRLLPALVVTGLLGGAGAHALLRGVSKPQTVACYEGADLEARAEVVGVDRRGPIAACADLWRRGGLGVGGEVPPLAECVLDSGVAGVFPATSGPDVCARLTLPSVVPTVAPPTTGASPQTAVDVNERFLAFREAVVPQFLDVGCMAPRTGGEIVRRALDEAGLRDWSVRGGEGLPADGFSSERPCATLSFRPEAREVVLVPAPPRR